MPAYTFECKECGETSTLRMSISEKENAVCPKCGSKDLKQIFKSIGILNNSCSQSSGCSGGFS